MILNGWSSRNTFARQWTCRPRLTIFFQIMTRACHDFRTIVSNYIYYLVLMYLIAQYLMNDKMTELFSVKMQRAFDESVFIHIWNSYASRSWKGIWRHFMRTGDEATKSLHYQVCVGHKSQPYDSAPCYQVGDWVADSRV